jgi:predicted phage terminase large subunit-like protein
MSAYNDLCIEHVSRVKMIYPEFRQHLIETAWRDGKDVPIIIEKAGQQGGYIQDLRGRDELRGFTIMEQKPVTDKFTRAMPWVAAAEGGKVHMVRGGWNGPFIHEAEAFTNNDSHSHDDQIDSVSIAYRELCKVAPKSVENVMM